MRPQKDDKRLKVRRLTWKASDCRNQRQGNQGKEWEMYHSKGSRSV